MRNSKNNITLSLENIISFSRNITSHFTGKEKIITLVLVIIMLSFINTTFTSALSYQSNVGVGFTFNPTLSVSISPSDLIISNLVPGNTLDSNIINVSVASNAAYGYTLSAMANGNNSNLTHSNGTNTFSSIATNADLSDLEDSEDTNIWGYSYKDNTVETPAWSNYNGLSNSSNTTLINANSNVSSNLDFKIAAKSSNTQAGGTYTGTINFTAVTNPTPMNLSESYFAAGKTRHNGYYAMQDMTTEICNNTEVIDEGSQTKLIDLRDDKVYWATKLKDGHCWMTQNLDLDLSHDKLLTSDDTDLNVIYNPGTEIYAEYNEGYNKNVEIVSWRPTDTTRDYQNNTGTPWNNSYNIASSLNPGEWYWDGNQDTPSCNFLTDSSCLHFSQSTTETNTHFSVGNYYNWSAAIASDNSSSLSNNTKNNINLNPQNSICPKGWRLPTISNMAYTTTNSTSEFGRLNQLYNSNGNTDPKLISSPLWFVRSGHFFVGNLYDSGRAAYYWSSTVSNSSIAYTLTFRPDSINPANGYSSSGRESGRSIRCLAR